MTNAETRPILCERCHYRNLIGSVECESCGWPIGTTYVAGMGLGSPPKVAPIALPVESPPAESAPEPTEKPIAKALARRARPRGKPGKKPVTAKR